MQLAILMGIGKHLITMMTYAIWLRGHGLALACRHEISEHRDMHKSIQRCRNGRTPAKSDHSVVSWTDTAYRKAGNVMRRRWETEPHHRAPLFDQLGLEFGRRIHIQVVKVKTWSVGVLWCRGMRLLVVQEGYLATKGAENLIVWH
jgi:hypothetical protein